MSKGSLGRVGAGALVVLTALQMRFPQSSSAGLLGPAGVGSVPLPGAAPARQSREEALGKSAGCLSCHKETDAPTMHTAKAVILGCTDCHGGDASVVSSGVMGTRPYAQAESRAHVQPRAGGAFPSLPRRERAYTDWLQEDLAYVRFQNPSDLRAVALSCGACHNTDEDPIVHHVSKSMMTHSGFLYESALYNNGVLPLKWPVVGESYSEDGRPRMLKAMPPPTDEAVRDKGEIPFLLPFPRWELSEPGNPYRVFERGGERKLEVGLPDPFETPGKPDKGLSPRGVGTLNRTDPIIIGAQKTRLVDPLLSLPGTNDHPGDYRASGCAACHVMYANDRSPSDSGPYADASNRGRSTSVDPTTPKGESGHPMKHVFTRSIPSSQCMTCHMHPGTNMVATYLGYTWWDNEADGDLMYPKAEKRLSARERDRIELQNPEGAALKGLWSDPDFLADVSALNPKLKTTQFADFHGHGWIFRAVFKRDRKGELLDAKGAVVAEDDKDKFQKAVHLKDIHLEKGMHCVDCHFKQDNHGNGRLYAEPRAAIEIDCVDCHGTVDHRANLVTSGPASPGTRLKELGTPFGVPQFEERGGRVVQHSMVTAGVEWEIPQTADSSIAGRPGYSAKADSAHNGKGHATSKMTCFACHSSWTTSCFGCHLSQRANVKKPMLHSEGGESRNWTSYNFQTLRDDVYFLAMDGAVTKNRVAPARSACAILASSQNQNREWIYTQQQTVSAGGFAGTAFSTYVPHTVRATETKACTDCHVSDANDNNAWMAELLMQGTGFVNFIGRYAWVGEGRDGFEAVTVTEREEPQAVIGSALHKLAYPSRFAAHQASVRRLKEAYGHAGNALSLQLRGEYLFAAEGKAGLSIYDVAQIDQKGFSQRITTAPVSPLGQRLKVTTKDATSVALPTTMTVDPSRKVREDSLEQPVHPLYDYAFVTDREEGLVIVGPLHTLLNGNPLDNFVGRQSTFNPSGVLNGATSLWLAGATGYATTPRGVVILDLNEPTRPKVVAQVSEGLSAPRGISIQFRYAFVVDSEGLKVIDVTVPSSPRLVPGALVPLKDARGLYLARTYAYVAAGTQGLVVVDIEKPEAPRLDQVYDAEGAINDLHDVKIGMTNGSAFAYLADGKNGLRVVQIVSANDTPGAYGFSPRPTPNLIATFPTHGAALAISRGLDRDRAVDETGNQIAVFGRRGARPFNLAEQQALYLRRGKLFTVSDE